MKLPVLFLTALLFCNVESRPQVPDQVQQFLQQSFFNPILAKVDEGGEVASHVISQITNITQVHAENDKHQGPGEAESHSSIAKILDKIKEQEESVTDSATESTTDSSSDDVEKTTTAIMPEEKPAQNKTTRLNHLDAEAIAKMKSLCPGLQNESDSEIVKFRYFEPKNSCFRYGFQGPCGEGMKLFIKELGSIYGQCDCRLDVRTWVYHEKSAACYKIFSQGGCSEGKYIDLTPEGKGTCSDNPCASDGPEFVKIRGICTKLMKPNNQVCKKEGRWVVDFIANRRTPDCVQTQGILTGVGILPCKPGSMIAFHGKCHVEEWDFGKED